MEMTSVLKVNSFKKDACFRLLLYESTVLEVQMTWEDAHLLCEKSTITYTRNATRRVIDSKRCPTKGSCKGNKCADVNPNSKVKELEIGAKYPGITGCFESCGGLGCDCFWPSSGCLYYRVHAVPADERIFQIFSCSRWQERVKVKVHMKRSAEKISRTYVLALQPNIPVQLPSLSFTLSVLALPPVPTLNTAFITAGDSTALWNTNKQPVLLCPSHEHAKDLRCSLQDNCDCTPAELQVVCQCKDDKISQNFQDISNVLPVIQPGLKITKSPKHAVIAHIEQGASAEILLNAGETLDDSIKGFMEGQCTADDTYIAGCNNCNMGAIAAIQCISR
uniref:Phlebovirus_G2 domain-containing protein n=1 Tax=Haemonchus contortus TaxID=6289 RepID=A0A7I4Z3M2_HAECO